MVKVGLHRVQVKSGAKKGKYHLIAQRNAIKTAADHSGRTRSAISSLIQRRKKQYGYAGYKKSARALPKTETLNLRSRGQVLKHQQARDAAKNAKRKNHRGHRSFEKYMQKEDRKAARAASAAAKATAAAAKTPLQKHRSMVAKQGAKIDRKALKRVHRAMVKGDKEL